MINVKNRSGNVLSMFALSLVLVMCTACPGPVKEDARLLDSRVLAENSTMKKRIPLIERENDVLKKENLQHRMKILDLESQVKQLGLDAVTAGKNVFSFGRIFNL